MRSWLFLRFRYVNFGSFKGEAPFEVSSVKALTDGFELTFTKPVDPKTAGDAVG